MNRAVCMFLTMDGSFISDLTLLKNLPNQKAVLHPFT